MQAMVGGSAIRAEVDLKSLLSSDTKSSVPIDQRDMSGKGPMGYRLLRWWC